MCVGLLACLFSIAGLLMERAGSQVGTWKASESFHLWCSFFCLVNINLVIESWIYCQAKPFMISTRTYICITDSASTPTTDKPLYHYTIFLGGTNDLGWGKPASEIWASIKAITAIPLLHGSKVLLMTVPECGVKREELDKKRNELNGCIKEDKREGV